MDFSSIRLLWRNVGPGIAYVYGHITTECFAVEFKERFKGHIHQRRSNMTAEEIDQLMDRQENCAYRSVFFWKVNLSRRFRESPNPKIKL